MLLKRRLILMIKNEKVKYYLFLFIGVFVYSIATIFLKFASNKSFLSKEYIFNILMALLFLGIYAIIWQQILKHIQLSVALSFKPVALILNLFWSIYIFNESYDVKVFIGILLIICGIFIMVRNDE